MMITVPVGATLIFLELSPYLTRTQVTPQPSDSNTNMSSTETKLPAQRILVVDDEPVVCECVKMMLAYDGHTVEVAGSGEEALAKYAPDKFDLVITDYCMNGMKRGQLAQALKRLAPAKTISFLTAF